MASEGNGKASNGSGPATDPSNLRALLESQFAGSAGRV